MQRTNDNPNSEVVCVGQRGWLGTLVVQILNETSPELAIKIAYDFGRRLRSQGAEMDELSDVLAERVERPFGENPLLPYIRAGFTAGFLYQSLPWRKQIEAEAANQSTPPRVFEKLTISARVTVPYDSYSKLKVHCAR